MLFVMGTSQEACTNGASTCIGILASTCAKHLSAESAARDDASAALVDQPDADFDASAAEADALIAVDTFCLQEYQSRQCSDVTILSICLARARRLCRVTKTPRANVQICCEGLLT